MDQFMNPNQSFSREFSQFLDNKPSQFYSATFDFLECLLRSKSDESAVLAKQLLLSSIFEDCINIYMTKNARVGSAILRCFASAILTADPYVVNDHCTADYSLLNLIFQNLSMDTQTSSIVELLDLLQAILFQDKAYRSEAFAFERRGQQSAALDFMFTRREARVLEELQNHFSRDVSELAHNTIHEYLDPALD